MVGLQLQNTRERGKILGRLKPANIKSGIHKNGFKKLYAWKIRKNPCFSEKFTLTTPKLFLDPLRVLHLVGTPFCTYVCFI